MMTTGLSILSEIALSRMPGWFLVGQYDSDVGAWLLHNKGESALLEVPEGLTVMDVFAAADEIGCKVRLITASHAHYDHLDSAVVKRVMGYRRLGHKCTFTHPATIFGDRCINIGGEPLWLISAPKHSPSDMVVVFRGVAFTGDIELGTLDSVNDEVPIKTRRQSMDWLRGFQRRNGYRVHTTISAHLDDFRTDVDWEELFSYNAA